MKINEIETRDDLAFVLKIPLSIITYVLYKNGVDSYYNSFEISKKTGGTRLINAPTKELKEIQKRLAEELSTFKAEHIDFDKTNKIISHGFVKDKSIITNAEIHRNKRFVLNIDIENFFGSFHFGRVRGYFEKNRDFGLSKEMATIIAQLTCFKGALPQGAPTSPIITNLICNILDLRISTLCKKYKLNYTRYADDLTFSTNNKIFIEQHPKFLNEINEEISSFGLAINEKKTRLLFKDSRQVVTGLVVNKRISVCREFVKQTRAMAENLYSKNEFFISEQLGTIKQLEGRFSFIDHLDYYNNLLDTKSKTTKHEKKTHDCWHLNSREKQYQKFLFYKHFFANSKPLLATEGKTDILHIKSALKKFYIEYPNLISKKGESFEYKFSFLNRSKKLDYYFKITPDGGESLKNIYQAYSGNNLNRNYYNYFINKSDAKPLKPVIILFDNEQNSNKPLKIFVNTVKPKPKTLTNESLSANVVGNLYIVTVPLIKGLAECEVEDLFDEKTLNLVINGKTFSRLADFDESKYFGKSIFANFVYNNYENIDFTNFKPLLDELNRIVTGYK